MLAERLGLSTIMVRAWLTGALLPPKSYFFRVVDILQEAEPDSLALRDGPKDEPPAKAASSD
jgi:hypothetical protein